METKPALVWSQGGVELYPVTSIHLYFILVVFPYHAELDYALGNGDDLEGGLVFGILLEEGGVFEGGCEFCVGRVSAAGFDCW